MPSPISISGSYSGMADSRSSFDKGWSFCAGRERLEHGDGHTTQSNALDSQLWHACAGAMVRLPQVGEKVIYFPQGHAEHAASPPDFPRSISSMGSALCRVISVNFLADAETDEVYARIRLQPVDPSADLADDSPPSPHVPDKTASFAKTLTQSDANNGGGFSVPRYCAETIFPRLDYSEDPPVQIVLAKDVHGAVWKFRHIYRGTPRRHLLTTGWSSFVNQKKLVAGDAIVFLRSASGELCVGVRRSSRGCTAVGGNNGNAEASSWQFSSVPSRQASRWELKSSDSSYDFFGTSADGSLHAFRTCSDNSIVATNFARNRTRITANAVLEAATLAVSGQPFDVVYYPRASISEFCVKASLVKTSLQQNWTPGMRFKMAVETEDASRISWFMGTIAKVQVADPVQWPNSPWKMLQVNWDEPDLLQGITRVSPWQVELVSSMQLPPFSLPKKKVRLLQAQDLQRDATGIMGFSMATFANNFLGHINPWHGFADTVSVGMQGARQARSFGLTSSDFQPNMEPRLLWESFYNKEQEHTTLNGRKVSTDLNMSSFLDKGTKSVPSTFLTIGSSSTELTLSSKPTSWSGDVVTKSKSTPFLLFGKTIDTSECMKSQAVSEGQGYETISGQHSALNKIQSFSTPLTKSLVCDEASDLSTELGTLNHSREADVVNEEKAISMPDMSINHCKVFRGSDDVGWTIDLSMFDSYEELFVKLALTFKVSKEELFGKVFCLDMMGHSQLIGKEPYRDFAKRTKRLNII
uniref:Auxin response factor n=1 Tax=Ceratopteris pteridoides TaxID=58167 RepID=A0A1X9T651_9MONI|nr:auxin response factor 10 [Ceratopteris pteridoides]